jgi:hypothetical protein
LRLQFFFCDSLLAGGAVGDVARPDFIEDRIARDIETALHAGGRRKGSMTLYNLLREYTSICFDIIDILRVVGQQLPLILKKPDECMSGRPFLFRRENILGNREENVRVLPEDMDIEDFLWIAQA